ncbi:MAG: HupE/UreJ family protein [Pseudomonadota bacterium]
MNAFVVSSRRVAVPRLVLVALAGACWAPVVHAHGISVDTLSHEHVAVWRAVWAGFVHPFTGVDHLLALLAVGAWRIHSDVAARPLPWVVTACLSLGAALGLAGVRVPLTEALIAASLCSLGVLLAWRVGARSLLGVLPLAGALALCHGLAHGAELPVPHAAAAVIGLVLASCVLQAAGIALAHVWDGRNAWWPRLTGGAVAAFGLASLLGLPA